LFQFTFRHPRHAAGWLQVVLPTALAAAVEWQHLRLANDRLPGLRLGRNEPDVVLQAPLRADPRHTLYVMEHHTGATDRWLEQLLRYVVHVRRVLWRRHAERSTCVIPVVLLQRQVDADDASPAATSELDRVLVQLQPHLHPVVHDLAGCSDADLRDPRMTPLAQLTLCCLATLPNSDVPSALAAIDRWGDLLRALPTDDGPPHPDDVLDAIACYVLEVTEVTEEQLHMAFAKHLPHYEPTRMTTAHKLRLEGRAQGLAEGQAQGNVEGQAQGKADTLVRLLARRFGPAPATVLARIRAANVGQLDAWLDALLEANCIDDVIPPGSEPNVG
jgi:hypothetical protein